MTAVVDRGGRPRHGTKRTTAVARGGLASGPWGTQHLRCPALHRRGCVGRIHAANAAAAESCLSLRPSPPPRPRALVTEEAPGFRRLFSSARLVKLIVNLLRTCKGSLFRACSSAPVRDLPGFFTRTRASYLLPFMISITESIHEHWVWARPATARGLQSG